MDFRGCFSPPSFPGVSILSLVRFAEGSMANFTSATEGSRAVLGMMRGGESIEGRVAKKVNDENWVFRTVHC